MPTPLDQRLINLRDVRALCVDPSSHSLDILAGMLRGFGVQKLFLVGTADEAQRQLAAGPIDLVLTDAQIRDETGYDLVRWLRRSDLDPNRYAPCMILAGHASESVVHSARTCGANFVLAKPTSAAVMMQRLLWVASGGRKFVESAGFIGPDRRWKYDGPPVGESGRRSEDKAGLQGGQAEPNLSQDEINAVFKPQRVSL